VTQTTDLAEWDAVRPLNQREFEQIRKLAHQTFGLDLKAGKEELVSARLRKLVRNCGLRSFQEYYQHIVEDSTGQALAGMIDALATNHTAFLREPDHFQFFRQQVLPQLSGREPVEAWSAACSSGEEVWTLACLLNEALPGRRIHIMATDISNKILRFASTGCYTKERCRDLPAAWLSRYFVADGRPAQSYRVAPALRAQVQFQRVNLVERLPWPHLYPVIFCRNVMIYFDRTTQERVVQQLSERLEPGGYLFVGHAESLTRISHGLEYVQPAIYRKPSKKEHRWTRSS
jgi:chemotaxis protein methyltransferase CheR